MAIWVTSDWHLDHGQDEGEPVRGIMKHCARPFPHRAAMNAALLANCNRVVRPQDTLYFLGDFCFGPRDDEAYLHRLREFRDQIACRTVHFVWGNHDREWLEEEYRRLFQTVRHVIQFKAGENLYFCAHYPHISWNRSHRGSRNLYGHHHGKLDTGWRRGVYGHSPNVLAMDVGADLFDNVTVRHAAFTPWSIDEIEQVMATKTPRLIEDRGPDNEAVPK